MDNRIQRSAVRRVDVREGAEAIAVALAEAQPGDTVEVGPGRVAIDGVLRVPAGVTLRGAGRETTVFFHDDDGPAIETRNEADVVLADFTVESLSTATPFRVLPEDDPIEPDPVDEDPQPTEWGLIFLDHADGVRIERVTLRGKRENKWLRGLCLRGGADAFVSDCLVEEFGRDGINLIAVREGRVENCEARFCRRGIVLFGLTEEKDFRPARAAILNNRCHGNAEAGIVLLSCVGEPIEDNECWDNGTQGIALELDHKNTELSARAAITANRCHGNAETGILLLSAVGEPIEGNECWDNGMSGIALALDPRITDLPARAAITANRCHGNAEAGIVLHSSVGEPIEDNECWDNGMAGIALELDQRNTQLPARAVITSNRCRGNAAAGIVLLSSVGEPVSSNECWDNGTQGIALQLGLNNTELPARAAITANRCHGNAEAGIVILSSIGDPIEDNECWDNGMAGIALTLDPRNTELAARAAIKANRCHGNADAGIVLFSAVGEPIDSNECWDNGTQGIALQLDQKNTELPARAAITANRCHGNAETGIVLLSAVGEPIEGNECWDNGMSGIALALDPRITDLPARAAITANRCHGNAEAGIVLLSCVGDPIEDNECWDNGMAGIALELDQRNTELPVRAAITANRCHSNDCGYSCIVTAEVQVADNAAFGNRKPSVAFGPDGVVLRHVEWPLVDPGETAEQTRAHLWAKIFAGSQAALLGARDLRDPDRMARFLATGALHDLRRWCGIQDWRRPGRRETVATSNAVGGTASDGLYAMRTDAATPDTHRFAARGSGSVARAVWDAVAGHVLDKRPAAVLIGATGDQRAAIDELLEDLDRMNGYDAGDPNAGPTPSGRLDLAGAVGGYSGIRVSRPMVRDHLARSEVALAEAPTVGAFLEPSRPDVWRRWRARTALLARSPETGVALVLVAAAFAVAILVGWAKGFDDPLSDPIGAAWAAVTANLRALELHDWLTLLPTLAALLSAGGILALVNHALPSHLALRPRALPWRVPASTVETGKRGAAWRRWARRRLWNGGQVAVIVLRDLVEWSDEDRDALHEIAALRNPDKSLIVVVESPTRGILDRTLLRALTPASKGVPATRFDAVMASLGPEPNHLDGAIPESTPDIGPLLGLPPGGGTARERALATIRGEAVGFADLIPTLALASTHHYPAVLCAPMSETGADVDDAVTAQIRGVARLHAGKADGQIAPLSPDGLDRWIEAASAARAVLRAERHEGRRSFYEVLGRAITRGDVAAALRTAFDRPGDEALLADYVQGALACGEVAALAAATAALRADEADATIRPNAALAALRGALQIAGERTRMPPGDSDRARGRTEIIETARTETLAALAAAESASLEHRSILARLYAFEGTLREAWTMNETDAQSNAEAEEIVPGSTRAAFEAEVAEALNAFEGLDRTMAREIALASLRLILSDMHTEAAAALRRRIDSAHGRAYDLAALIDAASSTEALAEIARRHAAIAPDLRATLLATAARAADTKARQLELADLLARDDGPLGSASTETSDAMTDIGRSRGVTTLGWSTAQPLVAWDDLLTVLGELNSILQEAEQTWGQIPLAELMIGTTDPIRGTVRTPDRMEFEAFMPWSSTMAVLENTDDGGRNL